VLTSPRLGMERVAELLATLPERLPQAA